MPVSIYKNARAYRVTLYVTRSAIVLMSDAVFVSAETVYHRFFSLLFDNSYGEGEKFFHFVLSTPLSSSINPASSSTKNTRDEISETIEQARAREECVISVPPSTSFCCSNNFSSTNKQLYYNLLLT